MICSNTRFFFDRQSSKPANIRSLLWLAILLLPTISLAAGTITPDSTLILKSTAMPTPADGAGDDCFIFGFGFPICGTDSSGDRIGGRALATNGFNKSQATIFQFYDFEIDDSDGDFDTVLLSQISGVGEFNGFLAQVGLGTAAASVILKVIDLGPTDTLGANDTRVIHKSTLSSHRLEGSSGLGISMGIKATGGFPFIGASGGPSLSYSGRLQKKVVRDGLDFGLQVLVKRGHSYRLYFQMSATAKRGAPSGLSFAQFQFGNEVTDVLGVDNWLDGLTETIDSTLPNIKAESMRIVRGFPFNWFQQRRLAGPEFIDSNGNSTLVPDSGTWFRDRAAAAGLPTSFQDVVAKRFRKRLPDTVEEVIEFPGLKINALSVMLQPDEVEIAADQTNRINEVIRLLLTPQGQRQSDLIDCERNGNGNSNSNGVGSGCDFPGASGQMQNGNVPSNQFGSSNPFGSSPTVIAALSPNQSSSATGTAGASPDKLSNATGGGGAIGLFTLAALLALALFRTSL